MFGPRYFGARYFGPRYFGSGGSVACSDLSASRRGFADTFTRGDSSDLGSDWREFGQVGSGLEILSNAAVCRLVGTQAAEGFAVAIAGGGTDGNGVGKIIGDSVEVRWNASSGLSNSDRAALTIFARNSSSTAIGTHYRLEMDSRTNQALLYRTGALLGTIDIALGLTCKAFVWRLTNQSGQVRHEFYESGVLQTTHDDTAPSRITGSGWYGFSARADDAPVVIGEASEIIVTDFAVEPLSYVGRSGGHHTIYQAFTGQTHGLYGIALTQYGVGRCGGLHKIEHAFTGRSHGLHQVRQDFTGACVGQYSYYVTFTGRAGGRYAFAIAMTGRLHGKHRIAEAALDRYELFRGVDAEPDLTGAAYETFTTLPHTTAAQDVGHTYSFVLRRRNAYNLSSQNVLSWSVTLDGSGVEVSAPPSSPTDIAIEPAASGAALIMAQYGYLADSADAGGGGEADTWLIYLTSDGVDPDPVLDTPVEVAIKRTGGIAALRWTSSSHADGLTLKALVRTRRSGTPDSDSTNTAIVSCTSETDGPSKPVLGGAGFGSVDSQFQQV